MASIKPVVKNDFIKKSGKGNIKIRISHEGKVRYISTQFDIEPHYMKENGTVSSKYPGHAKLNLALYQLMTQYNTILEGIGNDITYMDVNTIVSRLKRKQTNGDDIIKYLEERIKTLESEKRTSYATTYRSTIKHLKNFTRKQQLNFKEINLDFLYKFERYLAAEGKKINTIRINLNNIKAVFNHAIDNDIIKQELYPFRKFKVRQEQPEKRNLNITELKQLLNGELTTAQQQAIDLCMLSFYLRGINFKDMLYLPALKNYNERIRYTRYKNKLKRGHKVVVSVKIEPEAQVLIEKYRGEKHMLRFMDNENTSRKTPAYKDITANVNSRLETIAKKAGLNKKITTYHFRGAWATIAYSIGIPKDIISEGLGHKSGSEMTSIYIESDMSAVDKANRKVIDSVKVD